MAHVSIKEGRFAELLSDGKIAKIFAMEQAPGRFSLIGIDNNDGTFYIMRHGRENKERTWRLDNLGEFVKKNGVTSLSVQFLT